jgi:hypothetical protein
VFGEYRLNLIIGRESAGFGVPQASVDASKLGRCRPIYSKFQLGFDLGPEPRQLSLRVLGPIPRTFD